MLLLIPENIENKDRKSGYDHVMFSIDKRPGHKNPNPYQAVVYGGKTNAAGMEWRGPRRATGEEAAQDYCDYVNGHFLNPAVEQWETPEIDMGNGDKRHAPKAEPVRVVRKEFKGPHDLYDVEFLAPVTMDFVVRKVGITARGHSRYSDIGKTFGFTIRPLARAITYPTKAKAKKAEDDLIAKLCADPNWKRVGKEAFVPVKKED
jgi:hypothetical protein